MRNTEISYGVHNGSGFSGDYNDLKNKPVIPGTTNDLPDSENKRYITDAEKSNIHDPVAQNTAIVSKATLAEVKADAEISDAISKKHNEIHNHDASYEVKNSNIQTHIASDHAPSNAQKNSDITKAEIEAKLTGEISTHTHAGGGSGGGYAINVQALTSSPTDGATVYFGMLPKAPITTANVSKVYTPLGTIKRVEIYCYSGTAGTAEAWSLYVRKNHTTDYLIATVSSATNERRFANSNLNIAMNGTTDYIEIKGVQPTWVTNPLTCIYSGYIYLE